MEDQLFFKYYIPALEIALTNENINHGYMVYGPDWYIEEKDIRDSIDLFEQNNYEKYYSLFDLVGLYFDAKSHNFSAVDGVDISIYKFKLNETIEEYKKKFNLG